MSNFTEQAIRKSFVELLKEKPFDKVTVLDIADCCDINRNTFYYHYHDIYELLDTILADEEQRIFSDEEVDSQSWRDCILSLTSWARENEAAIKNIYRSVSRDRIENYIFESSQRIMGRYVRAVSVGMDLDEQVVENASLLYAATAEGLLLNWLREGMAEDLEDYIDDISTVFQDLTRVTLERASHLPQK